MYLQSFVVRNFRRLKHVKVDLDRSTTVFVGANNSGKTSAMHIFQCFTKNARFSIYDFTAECWDAFRTYDHLARMHRGSRRWVSRRARMPLRGGESILSRDQFIRSRKGIS
jgi:predicted ATP-binding protein involved in virulence